MSTILEALDAMYEVKGDAEWSANYRNEVDKYKSEQRRGGKPKYGGDPYSRISANVPMRTADDYNRRRKCTERDNKRNGCTETIDTLDGIL